MPMVNDGFGYTRISRPEVGSREWMNQHAQTMLDAIPARKIELVNAIRDNRHSAAVDCYIRDAAQLLDLRNDLVEFLFEQEQRMYGEGME